MYQRGLPTAETANITSRKRILVVEDEALIAMILEDMLADMGYAVVGPAGTVAAALQLADPALVDGALLDVHLAGISSDAVALALSEHGIPFAFVTGMVEHRITGFGHVPIVRKPFDMPDLERVVSELLA